MSQSAVPPTPSAVLLPEQEQFDLTLTLGGRYAGEQGWSIHTEKGSLLVRVQTDFAGVLPEIRRVQHSRMNARTLESQSYSEGDGRSRPSFETSFDRRSGLMSLRQGRDEASAPLTTEHHDPVSLLMLLRSLGGTERASAWLTGGRALIQRLPDLDVEGVTCYTYFLRPGNAYVYVEREAPYRLMRLIQPTDFGPIEANRSPAQAAQGSRRHSHSSHSERPRRRRAG